MTLPIQANVLSVIGTLSLSLWLSLSAWAICQVPLPRPIQGGQQGLRRREAFAHRPHLEVVLRFCGGLAEQILTSAVQAIPGAGNVARRLRAYQLRQLVWAGQPAGLSVHEALFISALLGAAGGLVGLWAGRSTGTVVWVLPGCVLGGCLLNIRFSARAQERWAQLRHQLPNAIDLAAMSMSAGSDFPGALRRITQDQKSVVAEELRQVLDALDLGITRRMALLALEERCPIAEVRDLVRAIVLSEKKGSSVTDALRQQAQSSRHRRSVRAEEAAARAGVLLIMPLMLLMGCVLILLVGPLLCRGSGF